MSLNVFVACVLPWMPTCQVAWSLVGLYCTCLSRVLLRNTCYAICKTASRACIHRDTPGVLQNNFLKLLSILLAIEARDMPLDVDLSLSSAARGQGNIVLPQIQCSWKQLKLRLLGSRFPVPCSRAPARGSPQNNPPSPRAYPLPNPLPQSGPLACGKQSFSRAIPALSHSPSGPWKGRQSEPLPLAPIRACRAPPRAFSRANRPSAIPPPPPRHSTFYHAPCFLRRWSAVRSCGQRQEGPGVRAGASLELTRAVPRAGPCAGARGGSAVNRRPPFSQREASRSVSCVA